MTVDVVFNVVSSHCIEQEYIEKLLKQKLHEKRLQHVVIFLCIPLQQTIHF